MTKIRELVVATKNKGKVVEIMQEFSNLPIKLITLEDIADVPEPCENGETFRENALIKAHYYAEHTGKACLADDSGLEVDALGGEPGVYSARYSGAEASDEQNNSKLLFNLRGIPYEQRLARFCCVLAFVDSEGAEILAKGVCEGNILTKPRGGGGFGYDPLFYIPDKEKTMAELSPSEKNSVSHRGFALKAMATKLARYLER